MDIRGTISYGVRKPNTMHCVNIQLSSHAKRKSLFTLNTQFCAEEKVNRNLSFIWLNYWSEYLHSCFKIFNSFIDQMKVCACACCSSVMSVWVIMRECLKFRVYWRLPAAWQTRDSLILFHELQKYNESGYDRLSIQFKCVI